MADIVDKLRDFALSRQIYGEEVNTLEEAADEIERLRTALRLIAEHPVEQSKQWEVGAREMLKLARTTLEHPHDR